MESNFLTDFLSEHAVKAVEEPETNTKVVETRQIGGTLLIGGCIDWEKATDKGAQGLDILHRVEFTSNVKATFSSASSLHTFILLEDGSVYGMGRNDNGQLGTGDFKTVHWPKKLTLPCKTSRVVKIATGRYHSMLLFENGEIYSAGANTNGQCGLGDSKKAVADSAEFKKISTEQSVKDISCGHSFSIFCDALGHVYTFGHPEYGQLGHNSTDEHVTGKNSTKIVFNYTFLPKRISRFVTRDNSFGTTVSKITQEISFQDLFIVAVSAGKNHCIALEKWTENVTIEDEVDNRVFTWGFGGYGRLGHSNGNDELMPREVTFFSNYAPRQAGQIPQTNKQKQIREVYAGNCATVAVSGSKHLYAWGSNVSGSAKEAAMYPKIQSELYDYPVSSVALGSNFTFAASNDVLIAWGNPTAGRWGFAAGKKSSANPALIETIEGLTPLNVSCGYGHVSVVVTAPDAAREALLSKFPSLDTVVTAPTTDSKAKKRGNPGLAGGGEKSTKAGKVQKVEKKVDYFEESQSESAEESESEDEVKGKKKTAGKKTTAAAAKKGKR